MHQSNDVIITVRNELFIGSTSQNCADIDGVAPGTEFRTIGSGEEVPVGNEGSIVPDVPNILAGTEGPIAPDVPDIPTGTESGMEPEVSPEPELQVPTEPEGTDVPAVPEKRWTNTERRKRMKRQFHQ